MDSKEILSHIDHTLLSPTTTWEDIQKICEEAAEMKTASICIPPCYIKRIKEAFTDRVTVCTVIGFPLGYNTTEAKVAEAKQALADGAAELDMVVNLTDVKNGKFETITAEIAALKEVCGNKILKVIIETCYLTQEEKIALCKSVTDAKADYIKTSTGFGTVGATLEDIRLFKANIGSSVKMKAAGGVRSLEDLEAFLAEGCERIGTSSAVRLLQGKNALKY